MAIRCGLPLVATYNENPVAVCAGDITFELSSAAAALLIL